MESLQAQSTIVTAVKTQDSSAPSLLIRATKSNRVAMNSVSGFESGSKFALVSAVSSQNPAFFHGTMAKERLTRLTDRHVPWWFDIISENRWLGEPVARFGVTLPRTIITYNIHLKKKHRLQVRNFGVALHHCHGFWRILLKFGT